MMKVFDLIVYLKRKTRMLKILTEGCNKHPSYRAKKKPTAPCEVCNKMWEIQQQIKQDEETISEQAEELELPEKVKFRNLKSAGIDTGIKQCPHCFCVIEPCWHHSYTYEWCPRCGLNLALEKEKEKNREQYS